ncbi:alpha/beta hydrolase [Yinghuangia seranimata]|uniref:alpha/beta hydrolase n=1 Tax=Yinghuangia seranimata TaxID=408067 RepID=UPI00248C4D45|nr:alpha/beta hydrolase family protein [Yinghuangia seranimata]MDI2125951.1 alpha/beta hydrolase family protein [Yinghuangia seranimata]
MPLSRRTVLAATAAAPVAALLPASAAVAAPSVSPASRPGAPKGPDHGARVVAEERLDARLLDLTIDSPALGRTAKVRLLLPTRWDREPHRDWPVLYLLHGAFGDHTTWTNHPLVRSLTEDYGVLVVMPEAGAVGYYSNWWNQGAWGAPAWETFHMHELRRLLEHGYRAGDARAAAGLSMGGQGALTYAARNPGVFRAAASYSGVLHTAMVDGDLSGPDVIGKFVGFGGLDPSDLWGDVEAQRWLWAGFNPYDLAPLLRGVRLYVSWGSGAPGPLDPAGTKTDDIERLCGRMSELFAARARRLRLDMAEVTGPGTHTWPYFERGLADSFPMLMGTIGARRG